MREKQWGQVTEDGSEMWDAPPVFLAPRVRVRDRLKLLFYPKKFMLYRWIEKSTSYKLQATSFRVLDAGCGTGGAVIDMSKLLPASAEVIGVDVGEKQIEIARERIAEHGVRSEARTYDGQRLPFPDGYFDAVYTSDVLGHVRDVPSWLSELSRVLKPGGAIALFAESAIGKHAVIRRYLLSRGLNIDPHAPFHISLYGKAELRRLLSEAGFRVSRMYGTFLLAFFLHPDEFYPALYRERRFPILRRISALLFALKRVLHPISTAAAEFYGLLEMLAIGRWVESQGYVILAKKAQK